MNKMYDPHIIYSKLLPMRRHLIVLICLFACFFFVNVSAENAVCQQRHCLAVVDAGSSGSRLHIYAFDLDGNNNPIQIDELWSKKIRPGLATLESKPEKIDTYLNDLFAGAPEQNMAVYFYATAGMRLLSQPKQQLYYQAIQQWFAAQTQWQLAESRTITGREEGVFAWLAINYQLGGLYSRDKPLVSVMDMGGASVQVAFPVQSVEKIDQLDLVNMDISGRHFVLFVHSFLGLGQTVLSHQFLDSEHCFALGYLLPSGISANGDSLACQRDISKLINTVHEVNRIVQPAMASNTANSWYAIGGVASIAADKPFSFENKQFTNQYMLEQADSKICHQQWQDLYAQYPNNEYLYGYCLFPAYYYALMVDGYGIKPEQPINYMAPGQGDDWSLGVVLHPH